MMQDTNTRDDLKSFARLVDVLAPWLDQVVIVGGWAHRLYRLHPLAQPLEYEPLATFDTDVAMPDKLSHHGEGIGARLALSGFTEELLGDMRPHLELLLSAPWQVEIGPATGFPTTDRYLVQIPNPVAYLVQKILIHERREIGNRAKDLLYMHDTIEVFGSALPELKKVWNESVRPLLSAKAVRSAESAPKVLFGEVSDAIREAARMAAGRVVSPAQLLETCEAGLSTLLA